MVCPGSQRLYKEWSDWVDPSLGMSLTAVGPNIAGLDFNSGVSNGLPRTTAPEESHPEMKEYPIQFSRGPHRQSGCVFLLGDTPSQHLAAPKTTGGLV